MRHYVPCAAPAGRRRRSLVALSLTAFLAPQAPTQNEPEEPVTALVVGHVHPVSGPVLEPGVILIRGERIATVGAADQVEIPDGATRLEFPDAHAYPGLVDALSDAFADRGLLADTNTTAGSAIHIGLHAFGDGQPDLAAAGVTTAYVTSQSSAVWRGLGAVVRPGRDGSFAVLTDGEEAAVQLRLTAGPAGSHPLARQGALKAPNQLFASLKAYEKSFEDYEKALKKYEEDFEKYLEHHRAKKKDGGEEEGQQPARQRGRGQPGQGDRSRGGRRGEGRPTRTGGRRGGTGGTPPAGRGGRGGTGGGTQPEPQQPAAEGEAKKEEGAKAPSRPKYPKQPKRDPAKEALLEVRAGKLPLRVEARRIDEVQAAFQLATKQEIPRLIVENPSAAGPLAAEFARRGVPLILTDILPGSVADGYGDVDPGTLPAQFADAGAAVAIASGSTKTARHLPLLAAYAIGRGMPAEAALRAITLTPAEVLGIGRQVGSLESGKLADVLVTSGSLFTSDSRVLRVLSSGQTVFEAKQ